ncbi:MAG: rhodanese-like domain-containing protein [bacterium]
MKDARLSLVLFCVLLLVTGIFLQGAHAFELITAYEAYEMVQNGEATLVDVRTLEEYVFVGNAALEPDGDPIAYLIPWEFLEGTDDEGNEIYRRNPDFEALFEQTFGYDKTQPLIIICRSGNRSSYAALQLEENGFTNIYEVDNKLKESASFPGGRGGFQGSGYKGMYNGYRGYPGRFSCDEATVHHRVVEYTYAITDENDSVSWTDMGLPMTQRVDPQKIPKVKKTSQTTKTASSTSSTALSSFMFYQPQQQFTQQIFGNASFQFTPYTTAFMNISYPTLYNGGLSMLNFPTTQGLLFSSGFPSITIPQPVTRSPQPPTPSEPSECGG